MRKSRFIVFLMAIAAAAALLAACAQANSTPAPQALKPVATDDPKTPKMDCQVISKEPTQGPTEASNFPPPAKDDWVLGKNQAAPLTIIEYSDFQ